jgi:hypothetical protein
MCAAFHERQFMAPSFQPHLAGIDCQRGPSSKHQCVGGSSWASACHGAMVSSGGAPASI